MTGQFLKFIGSNNLKICLLSGFTFTFHFHALEKEMATHSSVLAWRIPGVAEPGGLPSMVLHRVGHDWSNLAAAAIKYIFLRIISLIIYFYYFLKYQSMKIRNAFEKNIKLIVYLWIFEKNAGLSHTKLYMPEELHCSFKILVLLF